MKVVAWKIQKVVDAYAGVLNGLKDESFSEKQPGKWSKKEVLGHLVDSAQNNIQRFVRGQYDAVPKIIYDQDQWVSLQHYSDYDKDLLVQLWISLNRHLCRILMTMDPAHYERECNTGRKIVELRTLTYLADDYLQHLQHHLDQIVKIELSTK